MRARSGSVESGLHVVKVLLLAVLWPNVVSRGMNKAHWSLESCEAREGT